MANRSLTDSEIEVLTYALNFAAQDTEKAATAAEKLGNQRIIESIKKRASEYRSLENLVGNSKGVVVEES